MRKKNNGKEDIKRNKEPEHRLHPEAKKSIWALGAIALAIVLILAGLNRAGPAGNFLFQIFHTLFGWGYFVLPLSLFLAAGTLLLSERKKILGTTALGTSLFLLSVLGLIDIFEEGKGGWLGLILGSLRYPFGNVAGTILNLIFVVISIIIIFNVPLRLPKFTTQKKDVEEPEEDTSPVLITSVEPVSSPKETKKEEQEAEKDTEKESDESIETKISLPSLGGKGKKTPALSFKNYVPPPTDLLKSSNEKPTTGDLRANANVIKRTLEGFGIPVEMGEINVGPKVTRYTLKPAEGVKLTKIEALHKDLSLALAAHPIRIEAPIPGKSLVGIEVPNKSAAMVRLGNLMTYPEFQSAGPLAFVIGRDVTGEPVFGNIEKMPHLLIAGATGSGKSVTIHTLITSLLYKNSPDTLKLILIDPKRVELSAYENLPHLVSPVITENKKAASVFRWAISEMDRRYQLLQAVGSRDIRSYNTNGGKDDPLPYLVMVVDELADLMTSYGREVEGSIVRLAQMARATGIHLVLATQRPSVEVITGLIKANITSRVALQVASQIDSRTILDTGGAEKLLGGGDLLFISSDLSKPKRIQGAYISEEEINAVADFVRENNLGNESEDGDAKINFDANQPGQPQNGDIFENFSDDESDDALYDEAVRVVGQAQKASASLLQRRLKVGYARAARLLDLMEEKGIIGPGDGAKPRDVFIEALPPENQ